MRLFMMLILLLAAVRLIPHFKADASALELPNIDVNLSVSSKDEVIARADKYGLSALEFATEKGYNTTTCFLIDMRILSGQKRFFIYDMKNSRVIESGLVAHGSGLESSDEIMFSNEPGSYCSSEGRYKIGKPYQGSFGLAYKLYGLDETNDNAYERFVVLHSHSCVPEEELPSGKLCKSWGCPTVSPGFLKKLELVIDPSEKPILLWIYK